MIDRLQAGRAAYKVGDIENAARICRAGIAEAQSLRQVFRLRILLSECYWAEGKYEDALSLTVISPQDSPALDACLKAQVLNQRGFVLTQLARFAEAKATLQEALQVGASDCETGQIEITCATLFFYLCDYQSVEASGRSALAIAEKIRSPEIEASASASIGKSFMYRQRWSEAIPWFERSLEIFAREGFDYYAMSMRGELGWCHFALHEDDKAHQLFAQALQNSQDAGALARHHIDLANMGCLHLRRREHAAALDHFQRAVDIARKLGDSISTGKWLHNLALTYSSMGNPDLAAVYEKEAIAYQKKVAHARAAASDINVA